MGDDITSTVRAFGREKRAGSSAERDVFSIMMMVCHHHCQCHWHWQ